MATPAKYQIFISSTYADLQDERDQVIKAVLEMGHIPVEESLRLLKNTNIKAGRKIFIHINNTNPILNEASPEYLAVRQAGWEVAEDNWQLEL